MSASTFANCDPLNKTPIHSEPIEDINGVLAEENGIAEQSNEPQWAEPLTPEEIRWIYKDGIHKRWVEFCGYDSLRIKNAWQRRQSRDDKQSSEPSSSAESIVVRGGMYDVELHNMRCVSIYWPVLHTQHFPDFHVDWHAINDVIRYSEYKHSRLMRGVTSKLGFTKNIVDAITPYSVPGIRQLLNTSAMDILYYTSPLYGGEVRTGLQKELNKLYFKFSSRHPGWTGKVSVLAHSLGCVIVYDIVAGWMGPDPRPPSPAAPEVSEEGLQFTSHTILLLQPGKRPETRTYSDYENVNECMEGVWNIYEEHLKRRNPNTPTITYDISQLFDFVDELTDLSCLIYQKSTKTYAPYNKDWIKEKIYVLLCRAADHSE